MTPAGKKRLTAVAALAVAGAGLVYLATGNIEENLVYYWTPTDLLAKADTVKNATIRLGGMVQTGSKQWNAETLSLRFVMGETPEAGGKTITVVSTGAPPQMFREGIGCIVEGKFDGQIFHADRLMVKHSNEYKPPADVADSHQLYKTLAPETPATHKSGKEDAVRAAPAGTETTR
ncbi:MAG: cytochrome c maturation protein CcmE [Deltaproteobacteria bacterium]|nr:cytochrome c maturation protein CcmE [Deltaproteobacteria bacterium]